MIFFKYKVIENADTLGYRCNERRGCACSRTGPESRVASQDGEGSGSTSDDSTELDPRGRVAGGSNGIATYASKRGRDAYSEKQGL